MTKELKQPESQPSNAGDCSSVAELVERVQTAHWDMVACRCWFCRSATKMGYRPREQYLLHVDGNRERFDPSVLVSGM